MDGFNELFEIIKKGSKKKRTKRRKKKRDKRKTEILSKTVQTTQNTESVKEKDYLGIERRSSTKQRENSNQKGETESTVNIQ